MFEFFSVFFYFQKVFVWSRGGCLEFSYYSFHPTRFIKFQLPSQVGIPNSMQKKFGIGSGGRAVSGAYIQQ
jgi:hypothetical protein